MTGLRPCRRCDIANLRFSRRSALKAACLSLLPIFAQTQGLPPCAAGTQFLTVEDTDSATNLSTSLQCSSGMFNVSWIGEVVVTETMHVAEGTSLNIAGAASGATADGNNSTQLFFVDGASSLHLTDMILANGAASSGGAVYANQSRVSWSGDTSFTANTANGGGAIYAYSSAVAWDGDKTVFRNNFAAVSSDWGGYGGAILAAAYSNISWGGDTVFVNNNATYRGGAIFVYDLSSISGDGNTTFLGNSADYGAGVVIYDYSTGSWDGDTVFTDNEATYWGGAMFVHDRSSISCNGKTTFVGNSAEYGAGVVINDYSNGFWDGKTVFTKNQASVWGGGVLVSGNSSIVFNGNTSVTENSASEGAGLVITDYSSGFWDGDNIFAKNEATYSGGGLFVYDHANISCYGNTTVSDNSAPYGAGVRIYAYSSGSWDGETVFIDNNATYWGGGAFLQYRSSISCNGDTTFLGNFADYGAGVVIRDYSSGSWDGETVFTKNEASVFGGGAFVYSNSSIHCNGNTRVTDNFALEGAGLLIIDYSSGFWDGEAVFTKNEAGYSGGGLFVKDHSNISCHGNITVLDNSATLGAGVRIYNYSSGSWDGEMGFVNNNATSWGGAMYVREYSTFSCNGNTTFFGNSGRDGAGVMMHGFSSGSWSGTTAFTNNAADVSGGGLNVHSHSNASWTGTMTFAKNYAGRGGAMWVWDSEVSWNGTTTFADNIAEDDGGALYATLKYSIIWEGVTTFCNNTATYGNGGALGLYGTQSTADSIVNCTGETTFSHNRAFDNGGAMFSSSNNAGQYFEEATFQYNTARVGGAVATVATGNGNELTPSPSKFVRCKFFNNMATETGGAVEGAHGQEEFIHSYFEDNLADVGGALRVGGTTVILGCTFSSNLASSRGLAIAAVGGVTMSNSEFYGNSFYCQPGKFLEFNQESLNNVRYETVCEGCPSFESCSNCTIADADHNPTCTIVMDNTKAEEPGTELATLDVSEGYWRTTNESSNILACYNPDACLGGLTGSSGYCEDGYRGPYCAVCETEYSSSLSATCTRCSGSKRQVFVAAATIVTIVAVCTMVAFAAYLVSTKFEETERKCSLCSRIIQALPLQAFKIVIVVLQILTQFASVANVTYPGVYQDFLSSVDIINLDIGSIMSAGCLWSGIDFHDRLLTATIGPLVVMGLLALTYAVALRRNSMADEVVVNKIRNKHLSALLLLTFLVYSSVSSTVFQMFACDSLDNGNEYLRADYRLLCTDTTHKALQVFAGFMIAVYPVGIPLFYALILYHYRDVLADSRVDKARAQPIADLWAPYRPECFYYEVIECGRRIMLTGVVVFIYPNDAAQIAITFLVALLFFTVSEVLSPFESASDMWLSRGGHILVLLSVFDVLLLKVDVSDESSESQKVFAWVLVAAHILMVITIVIEVAGICYASRRRQVVEEVVPSRTIIELSSQKSFLEVEPAGEDASPPVRELMSRSSSNARAAALHDGVSSPSVPGPRKSIVQKNQYIVDP